MRGLVTGSQPRPDAGRSLSRPGGRTRPSLDALAVAVLGLVAAVAILWFGRHWSFFYDEWGIVLYRREGGIEAFLAPHNGHLHAVTVAAYQALFAVVGLEAYWPYQLLVLAAHLSLAVLLYRYARRRTHAGIAVALAASLLFLGEGWEVLFWALEFVFVLPLLCLTLLLHLRDLSSRYDLSTSVILVGLALASSGVGVAVAVAAMADAVLARRWRAALGGAVACLTYLLWFLLYRPGALTPAELRAVPGGLAEGDRGAGGEIGSLAAVPLYVAEAAQSSALALAGAHRILPGPLPLITLLLLGVAVAAAARGRWSPRLLALLAGVTASWVLLALVRQGHPPNASRYLYVGGFYLLLIIAELAPRGPVRRPPLALVFVAVAAASLVGLSDLRAVGKAAEEPFARQAALLATVLCDQERPPSSHPDPELLPGVSAGPARAAVEDLGMPEGVECPAGTGNAAASAPD